MVEQNGNVLLFACGKVGEVECFVWDRQSGITLAVFREVQPDLRNTFFFSEAGHHILNEIRMVQINFSIRNCNESS